MLGILGMFWIREVMLVQFSTGYVMLGLFKSG
jgi:hypothetical protein